LSQIRRRDSTKKCTAEITRRHSKCDGVSNYKTSAPALPPPRQTLLDEISAEVGVNQTFVSAIDGVS
jgi:hypothetical protein